MSRSIAYQPTNPGTLLIDDSSGAVPYSNRHLAAIWDKVARTLSLQYSHYDNKPILPPTGWADLLLSTDGGATYAAPASFVALVAWVAAYLFQDSGSMGGGTGVPVIRAVDCANNTPVNVPGLIVLGMETSTLTPKLGSSFQTGLYLEEQQILNSACNGYDVTQQFYGAIMKGTYDGARNVTPLFTGQIFYMNSLP
jgi:hypothetical protein